MRIILAVVLLLGTLLTLPGGSAHADRLVTGDWQTSLLADHPLVGRIWVNARKDIGTERDVKFLVEKADFVLLGESTTIPTIICCRPGCCGWPRQASRRQSGPRWSGRW